MMMMKMKMVEARVVFSLVGFSKMPPIYSPFLP